MVSTDRSGLQDLQVVLFECLQRHSLLLDDGGGDCGSNSNDKTHSVLVCVEAEPLT